MSRLNEKPRAANSITTFKIYVVTQNWAENNEICCDTIFVCRDNHLEGLLKNIETMSRHSVSTKAKATEGEQMSQKNNFMSRQRTNAEG